MLKALSLIRFPKDSQIKLRLLTLKNDPAPESGALIKVLPRLSKGGIIVLDDYGWWGYSSQKRVLDPIASDYGLSILELPTGQGLILNR